MDFIGQLFGRSITLKGRRAEAPGIETFTFEANRVLPRKAGQYYVYYIPSAWRDRKAGFRPFSFSNATGDNLLELTTRIPEQPSGFKQKLRALAVGQKIRAFGPYGLFALDKRARRHVMIAGGIGITPFRSMLLDLARAGQMPPVTLLYSSRDENIAFRVELDRLASEFPALQVHYLIEPERADAATIARLVPDREGATFYVSGPPPMVNGVGQTLKGMGVSGGRIKHDRFRGYPW